MKRESQLKAAFSRRLKQQLPDFVSMLFNTAGAPDRSISGRGRTTHWEFKHGTPDFKSPGRQELLCMRLADAGYCRYVIWQESRQGYHPRTLIVHPLMVHTRSTWDFTPDAWCEGYDHQWLVDYINRIHR